MVVFVIGGAGFIGRRVVRTVAGYGHRVISLDIVVAPLFEDLGAQVTSVRLDLSNFEEVVAAMATYKPDVVINLSYMRENLPRLAMKVNVLGMDNCFEAARLCDVGRVVYSSSIAIHSRQQTYGIRKIVEADQPTPAKQYPVHKVFNEWQAKEYREKHGMCITGVRAAHVAGIDKIIGTVDHVQCIVNPALGKASRLDYRDRMRCVIHTDDMAEVFVQLAIAKKPEHDIYNSGGESLSLGQIAQMVKKFIPEADISFENETGGAALSGGYLYDNDRLVQEFGISYLPYEQRVAQMIERVQRGGAS